MSRDTVCSSVNDSPRTRVVDVSVAPDETKPPLLVDPDRVLSAPVAAERLQAVAGRNAQVFEPRDRIEQEQLPHGALRDVARHTLWRSARRKFLRQPVAKRSDHFHPYQKTVRWSTRRFATGNVEEHPSAGRPQGLTPCVTLS
jgi:hypothetical protein